MDGPRIVDVHGVDLCVDTAGDAADPTILLIGGMGASMDWWEDEFCQRLASGQGQGGRFVIRYDHRDTGRSVSYPAGAPGYTGADLAADAVGVLDAFGRQSAHLAGVSMGGGIAQEIALAHPERVDSLVLMSTSPAVPAVSGRRELPPASEDLRAYFAGEIVDRTNDMAASMTNHAVAEEGELVRGRLDQIAVPTLVIHGTADPLFPFGHGEALAREIPHAELLPLAGVGHQVPPRPCWTSVIPAVLRHTSGGGEA
jgi:pimeloyl-ACP methyl ester carboxylesterase